MDKDNQFKSCSFYMQADDVCHIRVKDLVGVMPYIELVDDDGNAEDESELTLRAESVLFNTADTPTSVYLYNVATKESTLLNVPDITAPSLDIAHTETKLWLHNGNTVDEWDISLAPASFSYNRNITNVIRNPGLSCKDNTTLLNVKWIGINPNVVVEENITGAASVGTETIPIIADRNVSGGFLLTTTNKLIITTMNNVADPYHRYISQFDYTTGAVEIDVQISPTILYPYGLFIYDNEIYIAGIDSTNTYGEIWHIQKTAPYTLILYDTVPYKINGASQIPSQLTVHFT
jgi:hypothetical protein